VRNFTAFLGRSPDTATSEDLHRYQLHLAKPADRPGEHQRGRHHAAVILQSHARTARPRPASGARTAAAQGADGAERGGGGASPRSRPR